jgi:hypothetical protein
MTRTKRLAALWGLLVMAAAWPSLAQGLRIDQLGTAGSLSGADEIPIAQGGAPPAKKMTIAALRARFEGTEDAVLLVDANKPLLSDTNIPILVKYEGQMMPTTRVAAPCRLLGMAAACPAAAQGLRID